MEVQLAKLPEKFRQLVLSIEVRAVAGDILGDDQQLLDAGRAELGRLVQQLRHGAAAVLAPQGRDDAVGAVVVAALSDAQVGVPGGRGQNPLAALVGGVDIAQVAGALSLFHHLGDGLGDIVVAAGAQDAVHLRQLPEHILFIPLGHAAGHQDLPDLPGLLQFRHLQNIVNGLLAGRGQEAAGVDHHHVGALGLRLDGMACCLDRGHHLLAVDLILGTAKRDECNVV